MFDIPNSIDEVSGTGSDSYDATLAASDAIASFSASLLFSVVTDSVSFEEEEEGGGGERARLKSRLLMGFCQVLIC